MLTASTLGLDLTETHIESDPRGRVAAAFPINRFTGAEHSAVVVFEVAPGDYLPTHTDSAEEVLYIVAGQAEVRLGEARRPIEAGDLAVIPAMIPHSVANTGVVSLRVVGFFGDSEIVSTFTEPLQPMGTTTLTQGQAAAA